MLIGEILANEVVVALSHLLLLQDFDCSRAADSDAKLKIGDSDRLAGAAPSSTLAGHGGAMLFTLALVSQRMPTRHTRCVALQQSEAVSIADLSARISMALMPNQT